MHSLMELVQLTSQGNQGPFVSLMMAYIFNAMTHLAVDVRLMAFRFLGLVVLHYPPTFLLYAEKVFQYTTPNRVEENKKRV